MMRLLFTFALLAISAGACAQPSPLHGAYNGVVANLRIRIHLAPAADGTVGGTLDSLDQGALGIPCTDFKVKGLDLSFSVPAVSGTWKGTFTPDGSTLNGTWNQGTPLALNLARDNFVPSATPSPADGYWIGTYRSSAGASYRLQMTLKSDVSGKEYCSIDSLDLGVYATPCTSARLSSNELTFVVQSRHETWNGTLSADRMRLTGAVSGPESAPLNFEREMSLQSAVQAPKAAFDAPQPPASADEMQQILTRDLEKALREGALAPNTMAGVTIGILSKGQSRVFAFGAAKPDSIYEIGSLTKTFTGLILAQMIVQGSVHATDPVRTFLPRNFSPASTGTEITLLDLATQHSGLPRMPDNFHPADPDNPYANYATADLYAFLRQHGLNKPINAGYLYSNLGFGLLGQGLANRAGMTYEKLLIAQIVQPLGLQDTAIELNAQQRSRFIPGHTADHKPARSWELGAMSGAGAIRSTAADMLVFLNANMHPDSLPPTAARSRAGRTLAAAIKTSEEPQNEAGRGMHIGFAWMRIDNSGVYWHNGATGGYSSFAFFDPKQDVAAVVLLNTSPGAGGDFADQLGQHILQRLAGRPAISLAPR